jgi:hypothetical protein
MRGVIEFLGCRPNLEVEDLAPAAAFLREVLGFEVEVDEPGMGLMLLRRAAARSGWRWCSRDAQG